MSLSRKRDHLEPFRVAMRGLAITFRTQKHMRVHLYVVLFILVLGLFANLSRREMMLLLFIISLVVVAEMFNSAIEAVVDLVSPQYSPQAKFAKDISAGAVLITTIMAIVVAALTMLGDARWEQIKINLTADTPSLPPHVRLGIGILLTFVIIVIGKGLGKRGQILQGGLVSGHAAFGFFFATGIMFLTDSLLVSALAVLLAAIIAQSRWEAKIHSLYELALGSVVGTIVGLTVFGLQPK